MNIAAHHSMLGKRKPFRPLTWVDGEYYGQNGTVGYSTKVSRFEEFVPVVGGHSITWKWGDSVIGVCYLLVYNANKERVDYWSPNNSAGERTININASAAFVRYSVGQAFKGTTFFRDNTTGLYLVQDGKIAIGGGIS